MKKYEFTGETKNINGHILHQIRALMDFGNVKIGDLGGWIESEKNLSQDGNAWIYGNARVYDRAWVYGDARVYGNAEIYGDARVYGGAGVYGDAEVYRTRDIFWIDCIGSRNDTTTFFRTRNKQIHVECGCFSGTIDEFETTVRATHKENTHAKMYMLAIQMAKLKLGGD